MFDDEILTIEEVAKYLRVSERTVYDWAQKGEIPAGKFGTVWRFMKSEIEKWVSGRLSPQRLNPPHLLTHPETLISPDRIVFLKPSSYCVSFWFLLQNVVRFVSLFKLL